MEPFTELLTAAIEAGTPLLLTTLGEIYAERSGILNLGVEGVMALGAVTAFYVTLLTGSIPLGLSAACLAGLALASLHAFTSITIRSNQVISGLALAMLGLGLSSLMGKALIGIPLPNPLERVEIPLLSGISLIGAFFRQNPMTYLTYVLTVVLWFILFKTRTGVCIRMVGENPRAADAVGVNVNLTRYLCSLLGGALAGLGGAYLSTAYTPAWVEGMTAGQGWISLALVIFAAWNPLYAPIGAYLFGGIRVLQYRLQPLGVSPPLLLSLPYVCTIAALAVFSSERVRRRVGAPAALGKPYSREERV